MKRAHRGLWRVVARCAADAYAGPVPDDDDDGWPLDDEDLDALMDDWDEVDAQAVS